MIPQEIRVSSEQFVEQTKAWLFPLIAGLDSF